MQFPTREADVLRLAGDIAAGLAAHPEVFPSPPFTPEDFHKALGLHDAHREAQAAARNTLAESTVNKGGSLSTIENMSKAVVRFGENVTGGDAARLQLIGWGGRRARSITDAPGQVRTLEIIREGKNWIFLDWKEPIDGGQALAYRVQRRMRDGGGDWENAGMAMESEITLHGQESGVEYEYQVIAANKAGEGPASNIVRAVL